AGVADLAPDQEAQLLQSEAVTSEPSAGAGVAALASDPEAQLLPEEAVTSEPSAGAGVADLAPDPKAQLLPPEAVTSERSAGAGVAALAPVPEETPVSQEAVTWEPSAGVVGPSLSDAELLPRISPAWQALLRQGRDAYLRKHRAAMKLAILTAQDILAGQSTKQWLERTARDLFRGLSRAEQLLLLPGSSDLPPYPPWCAMLPSGAVTSEPSAGAGVAALAPVPEEKLVPPEAVTLDPSAGVVGPSLSDAELLPRISPAWQALLRQGRDAYLRKHRAAMKLAILTAQDILAGESTKQWLERTARDLFRGLSRAEQLLLLPGSSDLPPYPPWCAMLPSEVVTTEPSAGAGVAALAPVPEEKLVLPEAVTLEPSAGAGVAALAPDPEAQLPSGEAVTSEPSAGVVELPPFAAEPSASGAVQPAPSAAAGFVQLVPSDHADPPLPPPSELIPDMSTVRARIEQEVQKKFVLAAAREELAWQSAATDVISDVAKRMRLTGKQAPACHSICHPPWHAERCPNHVKNQQLAERVLLAKATVAGKAIGVAFGSADQSKFLKSVGLPASSCISSSSSSSSTIVSNVDILGGKFASCPQEVHDQMLVLAARGHLQITNTIQRAEHIRTAPLKVAVPEALHGAMAWGYINPSMRPPRGLQWKRFESGSWKLYLLGG
ncbi:unnamed protein product, partial [Polarella glacialis]